MTPRQIKKNLQRLGIPQNKAAAAIRKSPAMVSMVLSQQAKSRPVLEALSKLIAGRIAGNGQQTA